MPIKSEREYRDMTMAADEERMIVRGYASTFNDPYVLTENDKFVIREQVSPDAFTNTDMSDVIMQYNHEGRVFARISNNTLTVTPDERGLLIEADLGGTELGRQLYEEIKGGYTNKMSFGFVVDGEERADEKDPDGRIVRTRTITSVRRLYDVSAVSLPANDATSISIRSLTDGEIEKIQAELLEAERAKETLKLRLQLERNKRGN